MYEYKLPKLRQFLSASVSQVILVLLWARFLSKEGFSRPLYFVCDFSCNLA